jgi:hypothetical protein
MSIREMNALRCEKKKSEDQCCGKGFFSCTSSLANVNKTIERYQQILYPVNIS